MSDAKRTILVTGASRGIGAALATALAGADTHLILVARTVGGLEETDDAIRAKGGASTLLPLDLTQPEGIERMAFAIAERFGRLDGLALIAGALGELGPIGHRTIKAAEALFALNTLANWRLLRACEPLLRVAPAARVVVATDRSSLPNEPFWGVYRATKAALETLTLTFAAEVADTAMRVNLVDPGPVATALRRSGFPGEDSTGLATPSDVAPLFARCLDWSVAEHGRLFARS